MNTISTVAHHEADVRTRVNRFYEELPFNVHQAPADAAATIRAGNAVQRQYPGLHTLLRRGRGQSVLDVGCGGGWFVNSVAVHYPAVVTAIDLCDKALAFARATSLELGSAVTFRNADIFSLPGALDGATFDIVNSLGVLHHTHDCRRALACVLPLVRPGGFLHLGLYHLHGRRPFLDMFEGVRRHLGSEDVTADWDAREASAFDRYKRLYPPSVKDEVLLRSWFRDQVLHPHETQHTIEEVHGWLTEHAFEPLSTSLNRFEPVTDWNRIFELERTLGELSYRRNVVESTYYPGFFVIVARRPPLV